MKTVEHLEYKERTKTGNNSTVGEHFFAYCSVCKTRNLFWMHEVNTKKADASSGNGCEHFSGFGNELTVIFSDEFDIQCEGNNIFIDGVLASQNGVESILEEIENRAYELDMGRYSYRAEHIVKIVKTEKRLWLLEKYLKEHVPQKIITYYI